uniref:Uncharacterized protein n=1 Tax=Glossina austeni TaxID=7395 RepID=A0A1A9VCI2_GLOAU
MTYKLWLRKLRSEKAKFATEVLLQTSISLWSSDYQEGIHKYSNKGGKPVLTNTETYVQRNRKETKYFKRKVEFILIVQFLIISSLSSAIIRASFVYFELTVMAEALVWRTFLRLPYDSCDFGGDTLLNYFR